MSSNEVSKIKVQFSSEYLHIIIKDRILNIFWLPTCAKSYGGATAIKISFLSQQVYILVKSTYVQQ